MPTKFVPVNVGVFDHDGAGPLINTCDDDPAGKNVVIFALA